MSQVTGAAGAPQPPTGTIRLTLQGNVLTAGLTPSVAVGGHPIHARFGVQDVPVWAGRVRVEAHTQWLRRYGQAELDVDVPPGAVVPVYYAVPWHQFTRGAMGTTPQRRPGVWMLALFLGVPLLLAALAVAGGILAGGG
jgi:hypothetical protein